MELIFSMSVSSLSEVPQLSAVLHVALLYSQLPALRRSQSCSVKLETHWDICPREVSPDIFLIKAHSFIQEEDNKGTPTCLCYDNKPWL